MPRINNIDAYIARRIEKELDKSLATMIEKKMRNFHLGNFAKQSSKRLNRSALNDLTKALYQTQFANLDILAGFGNSSDQLIQVFSQEIKNSLFKNI